MLYEPYLNTVDENAQRLCAVSDALWDYPEMPLGEYRAAELLTGILEELGFTVERGVAGIPTAFTATYGTGRPHLGVLAEYDGLPSMSQQANVAYKAPIPGQDTNHGCGHNLFAGGSLGAALAVKAYIQATGTGSITLFGCPGEEGGGGKVFMAREGVFRDVEAVVSWHPEKMYMVRTRPSLANVKVDYSFEGIAAHAGGSPHRGRSALDAVELMNVGANFLREHMELTSRVHYAILDAGGTAANMVQSHAVVEYLIRAVDAEAVRELKARVDRIAQGAAMMTDTTVTSQVISAYANLITIPALQALADESMRDVPLPVADEKELEFAKALQATVQLLPQEKLLPPFADRVLEPAPPVAHGGSTDTADVSWNCPTVQMHIATWAVGTPGHSWQSTAQGKGSYAKKAMLYAAKAVAGTLIRLMERPQVLQQAKEQHAQSIGQGYVCGIPEDVKPAVLPRP